MSVGISEFNPGFLVPHLPSLSYTYTYVQDSADDRYAANAITLPQMDMYSNLLSTDASAMLDHLSSATSADLTSDTSKPFDNHWRGRYGCTESEQEAIWTTKNGSFSNPDITPDKEEAKEAKKVVELKFKTYEGDLRVVEANIGDTLLQVARANDLPSMEGSCGGNLGTSLSPLLNSSLLRPMIPRYPL